MDPPRALDDWPAEYVVAPAESRSPLQPDDQAGKLMSMGRLAAGIAHEINTPIQYVSDNLAFLERALGDLRPVLVAANRLAHRGEPGAACSPDEERLRLAVLTARVEYLMTQMPEAVSQSLEGLDRVAGIVRAVREFSHPPASDVRPVDVPYVVDNAMKLSRHVWHRVADVTVTRAPGLCMVQGYPGRLQQTFVNLVVNAAHAIAARTDNVRGQIDIDIDECEEFVEVAVTDNGVGIPAVVGRRVFEPFYTSKPVGEGTGQGLALVRSAIIDMHGGALAFSTKAGEGTTMVVRIPRRGARAHQSGPPKEDEGYETHSVC